MAADCVKKREYASAHPDEAPTPWMVRHDYIRDVRQCCVAELRLLHKAMLGRDPSLYDNHGEFGLFAETQDELNDMRNQKGPPMEWCDNYDQTAEYVLSMGKAMLAKVETSKH